jgi:hypothetical protein
MSRDEVDKEIQALEEMKKLQSEVEAFAEFLRLEEKRNAGIMRRFEAFMKEWRKNVED